MWLTLSLSCPRQILRVGASTSDGSSIVAGAPHRAAGHVSSEPGTSAPAANGGALPTLQAKQQQQQPNPDPQFNPRSPQSAIVTPVTVSVHGVHPMVETGGDPSPPAMPQRAGGGHTHAAPALMPRPPPEGPRSMTAATGVRGVAIERRPSTSTLLSSGDPSGTPSTSSSENLTHHLLFAELGRARQLLLRKVLSQQRPRSPPIQVPAAVVSGRSASVPPTGDWARPLTAAAATGSNHGAGKAGVSSETCSLRAMPGPVTASPQHCCSSSFSSSWRASRADRHGCTAAAAPAAHSSVSSECCT